MTATTAVTTAALTAGGPSCHAPLMAPQTRFLPWRPALTAPADTGSDATPLSLSVSLETWRSRLDAALLTAAPSTEVKAPAGLPAPVEVAAAAMVLPISRVPVTSPLGGPAMPSGRDRTGPEGSR